MYRKFAYITGLLVLLVCGSMHGEAPSLNAYIGTNLFQYQEAYLDTGIAYIYPFNTGIELDIAMHMGIATIENIDGTIQPDFVVPINGGINFLFPGQNITFFIGIGLTPVMKFNPEDFSFYIGPYTKTGFR